MPLPRQPGGRAWICARAVAVAVVALASTTAASAHGVRTPLLSASATYADTRAEDSEAPDIGRVVVSGGDGGPTIVRIDVRNRPRLTDDMGIELLVDVDGSEATGNRSLRLGLGVDYLVTVLARKPRLLAWSSRGEWRPLGAPTYSYERGVAALTLRAPELEQGRGFRFATSVSSGMVAERGGVLDITNAHFDFAPDVGRPAWSFASAA
jgi:hypothetical protein